MLRFHTTVQACPKSVRKLVLSCTHALHMPRGRLALLLLSHTHLHRFVLPWSQYKNLLREM